jgi:hypothetical protein
MIYIIFPNKYLQTMSIFGITSVLGEDEGAMDTILIPEITRNSYNTIDNSQVVSMGPNVKIGGPVSFQQGVSSRSFGTALWEFWIGITMPVKTVVNMIPKPILVIMILAVGFESYRFVRRNKYETAIYNFISNHPGWSVIIGCFAFMAGKSIGKFLLM